MGVSSQRAMSLSFSPSRLDRAAEGNEIVPANEAAEPENKIRVQQLSNKLTTLQDELELKVLDDKLLRAQVSEEDKLRPLHEQITSLQQELAAERLSREVMDETCFALRLDLAREKKLRE